jgi:NAD(P)H-dependent flavin oxidoreductase YrpB (nitropropane dioxygenase family)
MKTQICDLLGIQWPIVGFTPSAQVAAAISRAGGLGVLGAVRYREPDELEEALRWMDAHVDGKPYGVDVVMPASYVGGDDIAGAAALIPEGHRRFVDDVLTRFAVPPLPEGEPPPAGITAWMHCHARSQVDVALRHPIRLIANALGSPPADVIERAHQHGVVVAALAGKAKHALSHARAGVDIIVAQGHEAGGHTGEVTTMVLVPEIVDAVAPRPVLAAGGIGTGRQLAAALALGAQGGWLGSVWLTTSEYRLEPAQASGYSVVTEKLLAATSSDTVRSRVISGKPARMLRTAWTEAWSGADAPPPLPMPLQGLLVAEAEARVRRVQHRELMGVPVGQIVGQMNCVRPVADVVDSLVRDCQRAARTAAALCDA